MNESTGKEKTEELEEHLQNVGMFYEVLDGIRDDDGKHDNSRALTAMTAALQLYYSNRDMRIVWERRDL